MLRVVLTLDYEIHGSGRGDPRALMVEPTERLMALLEAHGARLTIMADVAEVLRFRQHAARTGRDTFAAGAIEDQLRRAVAAGHDVQLHLHPSYLNATLRRRTWQQDYTEYDLARLPPARLAEIIALGKRYLEDLLRPVAPGYRCFAFRAANWSMVPSPAIVDALVAHGFLLDTSVFKHGRQDGLVRFDYSRAPSALVPWPVDRRDICRRDPAGPLLEVPIYCERQPIWRFLTLNRLYRVAAQRLNPLPAEAATAETAPSAPWQRLAGLAGALLRRHPWKLDFNQCTGRQLVAGLRRAQRRYGGVPGELPLVLIGHSKTFTRLNARSLRPFLRHVRRSQGVAFGTFGDLDLAGLAGAGGGRARDEPGDPASQEQGPAHRGAGREAEPWGAE